MNNPYTTRHLVDLALAWAKAHQSLQTGFVHYCHQDQKNNLHTIPLLENFLFVLTLLRTRNAEGVMEGRALLEKLLSFQDSNSGNFPEYLHDFPHCKDQYIGAHLLPIFYWILKTFAQLIGSELRQKLESASLKLLNFILELKHEKPVSYQLAIKVAGSARALGFLLDNQSIAEEGEKRLKAILEQVNHADFAGWGSTSNLADTLIALQMNYSKISESEWSSFWEYLGKTWHRKLCCYVGPALKEWQVGSQPQVNLYDLFLGTFSGAFSARAKVSTIFHLYSILVRHNEEPLYTPTGEIIVQGHMAQKKWQMMNSESFAYATIDVGAPLNPAERGFHLLRYVWGDEATQHTLDCQAGNAITVVTERIEGGLRMTFYLAEESYPDDKEKCREVIFYVDKHPDLSFYVGDGTNSATTFLLGDKLVLRDKKSVLFLQSRVESEEKNALFMGHLMLGNRPSQQMVSGSAFDWQIFFRTVRRSEPCKIVVDITHGNL